MQRVLIVVIVLLTLWGSSAAEGHEGSAPHWPSESPALGAVALPASRLFATAANVGIIEINPTTGAIVNTMGAPADRGVSDGLAYGGEALYYLSGSVQPNTLYTLDPDDGKAQRSSSLPESTFRNALAQLDGLVYILDWSALTQDIHVVEPGTGSVLRVLDIDGVNPDAPLLSGGMAGIASPPALLVTTAMTKEILEIDPVSGRITGRFEHGQAGAAGLATVDSTIFLGLNASSTLHMYSRDGTDRGTMSIEGAIGFQSLGGDPAPAARFRILLPLLELRRR